MLKDSCVSEFTSRVVNVEEARDSVHCPPLSEVVLLSILSEVNNTSDWLRVEELVILALQELQSSVTTCEDGTAVVLVRVSASTVEEVIIVVYDEVIWVELEYMTLLV